MRKIRFASLFVAALVLVACGEDSASGKDDETTNEFDDEFSSCSFESPKSSSSENTKSSSDSKVSSSSVSIEPADPPLIWVKEETVYIKTGDSFELDASVNKVWQGIDWFTWECKDMVSGKTLETKTTKYDYAANGNSFKVSKESTYSTKADSMNCIVSAQETGTKATFSDTTVVRLMKKFPTGVITAADTVYLWSGDESVDDEAVYFYSPAWGGKNSTLGDFGNKDMQDFRWKFSNVDGNFYQGNADGSLDTSIAEFNTAFIRRTREGSVTITLDFRDSISEDPILNFYNRHRAKEVSHEVYFSKAWKNIGKDTVITKTTSTVAPSLAIVNSVPIIAYAESDSKVVFSRLSSGNWSSLGSVTTSTLKKLSAVAHGSDFYVGVVDNSGLTVYRSASGTSAPAKVGGAISGIKYVKLVSNGSGNPHAVVINSDSKIEMYDIGSSLSKNSKFGTMDNGLFKSLDASLTSNGLVVVSVDTSSYNLYVGATSSSDFSNFNKTLKGSEIGVASVAMSGNKVYMVYYSRATSTHGTHVVTGTLSGNNISWGSSSFIRPSMIAYNISLAVYSGTLYAAFDDRASISQVDVYRYEGGKWHVHGENQLPYFSTVFYNCNKYYLRGLYPTLAFDNNGKLHLSMLAHEGSGGSGKNNGPLVMKYVADNWTVKDWGD